MSKFFYPNFEYIFDIKEEKSVIFNMISGKQLSCNRNQSKLLKELLIDKKNIELIENVEKEAFLENVSKYNLGYFLNECYGYEPTRGYVFASYETTVSRRVSTIHIKLSSKNTDYECIDIRVDKVILYLCEGINEETCVEVLEKIALKANKVLIYDGVKANLGEAVTGREGVVYLEPIGCKLNEHSYPVNELAEHSGYKYIPIDEAYNNAFQVNAKTFGNIFITIDGDLLSSEEKGETITQYLRKLKNIEYWYE